MIPRSPDADGKQDDVDPATIAVITVTYNPDIEVLDRQLSQLPSAALKVVVDNASWPELRSEVGRLAEKYAAILLQNDANLGLPAALNQGARQAQQMRPACQFLLLLDQDTEPGTGGVEQLVASYDRITAVHGKTCCIGPRLVDVSTGLEHGFHQIKHLRWSRRFLPLDSHVPVSLTNLNGSGTLMPFVLFNELGGLEEDLFIDHVDTEWSFRILAAGYGLYGIPGITFHHRMGERSLRFWWFGWRIWPYRSPPRHYYLFRNAMRLMRRSYVPLVWKIWATIKLGLTFIIYVVFDAERGSQVRHMIKGIRDSCELAPEFRIPK